MGTEGRRHLCGRRLAVGGAASCGVRHEDILAREEVEDEEGVAVA